MASVTGRRPDERVLNLLLLDTSGSMRRETKDQQGQEKRLIDQLNDGLAEFTTEIKEDNAVADRVDIALVSFGGEVTLEQAFQPIKSSWVKDGPPTLSASGSTPMCEAIVKGLNHLESHMVETDQLEVQALIWLLTDGRPDNIGRKWDAAKRNIEQRTADDDITFYAVGLGEEADMETLGDLVAGVDDENKSVFHLEKGRTREFFMRASESIKQNSENIGKPDYDDDLTDGPYDTIHGDTTDDDDQSDSFDEVYGETTDDGSEKSQSENSTVSDREISEGDDVRVGGSAATIGPEVETGSEGTVYRIQGNSDSVLKIFNKQTRDEKVDKVRAMIKNPPIDPTYDECGVASIIWPQEIAKDPSTGAFLGYKMPYRDLEQTKSSLEYAVTELKWDSSTPEERYKVAYNLALVVNHIHDEGHAIGDFNHDNIRIHGGLVSLTNCDAFHITDSNTSYPNETYYPRYAPPEGLESHMQADINETDRFGLGVHVFQLLMEGHHPYLAEGPDAVTGAFEDLIRENQFPYDGTIGGIRPHEEAPDYDQLPKDIRLLFSECFRSGGKLPSDRPTANEWIETLESQFSESGPDF